MDKIKYIKIEDENGNLSDNIPIGADASNIDTADGNNIEGKISFFDSKMTDLDKNILSIKNDTSIISETIKTTDNKINTLESRVNNLSSLKEGSTTGDAELIDARVGYDGYTYDTAGDAIRNQINSRVAKTDIFQEQVELNLNGYIGSSGNFVESSHGHCSDYIDVNFQNIDYCFNLNSNGIGIAFYDNEKKFLKDISVSGIEPFGSVYGTLNINSSDFLSAKYVRFSTYENDNSVLPFFFYLYNEYNLDSIKNKVENVPSIDEFNNIELKLTNYGYYRSVDGIKTDSTENSKARCSDIVKIPDGSRKIIASLSISNLGNAITFFNKDMVYLKDISISGTLIEEILILEIDLSKEEYKDARYVAISAYSSQVYFDNFYANIITRFNIDNMQQQIDSIASEYIKYNDLLEINCNIDVIHGYFNREIRRIALAENARSSELIEVGNYNIIKAKSFISSAGNAITFFDKNKKYLEEISIAGDNTEYVYEINLSEEKYKDVVYVQFSVYIPTGHTINEYYLYLSDGFGLNEKIDNSLVKENVIFNLNGYWNYNNKSITEIDSAKHSDYIKINSKNEKIVYKTWINSAGSEISFFNKDLEWVAGIQGDELSTEKIISVKDYPNAEYFSYSIYVGGRDINDFYCYVVSEFYQGIENIIIDTMSKYISNQIMNKNILIFGDSITDCCNLTIDENDCTSLVSWKSPSNSYVNQEGETIKYSMWPKIIKDVYHPKEIRNYAKSGATYKDAIRNEGAERQNLSYQIDISLNDLNNPNGAWEQDIFEPDIIIFALGINDGESNDTYESAMEKTVFKDGNPNIIDIDKTIENLDMSKFSESVRRSFLRIKKAFPYAQSYVILPLQVWSNYRNESSGEQLSKIAKRCGMIVIDGSAECGIIRELEDGTSAGASLKDGLHPNEKGQNMMARMIISAINSHYVSYTDGFNI